MEGEHPCHPPPPACAYTLKLQQKRTKLLPFQLQQMSIYRFTVIGTSCSPQNQQVDARLGSFGLNVVLTLAVTGILLAKGAHLKAVGVCRQ